jgi:hypothetical protein
MIGCNFHLFSTIIVRYRDDILRKVEFGNLFAIPLPAGTSEYFLCSTVRYYSFKFKHAGGKLLDADVSILLDIGTWKGVWR